ncbi:WD40 repeat domain-containing protein [Baaleninema sp.]|uniref:WD40 repeat domain-containing protein n=1 Tax=Baaleninema sp. TaxID=3101197 RepID=UPI003D04A25F
MRSLSWAKGLALLLLLLVLAAVPLFRYLFSQRHADTVNTVNFIDRGTRVLSGSRDRHLFRWEVNRPLENLYRGWNGVYFTGGGDAGASVRVLRERPLRDSERLLVAAGLTNGEIQLWDAASNAAEPIRRWNRNRNGLFDNVFDLSFSPDTRYLFSAHGSGFVRQWDLDGFDRPNSLEDPSREIYLKKATYAIADTDGVNGDRWLLVGGEKNAFWVWNWNDRRVFDLSSIFRQKIGESAYFEPIYSKTDYITTMAVRQRALVTADTQGYVRIWDLEAMRGCLQEADRPKSFEKEGAWEYERDFDYFARNWTCDRPLIRWQGRETHRGRPVRSVALTHQGQCYYLASVGDDGRVVLWSFEAALLEPGNAREPEVRTLARLPRTPLNSVDIFADIDRRSIFVVSDGEDGRIQLYRRRIAPDANCQ